MERHVPTHNLLSVIYPNILIVWMYAVFDFL